MLKYEVFMFFFFAENMKGILGRQCCRKKCFAIKWKQLVQIYC